MRKLFLILTLAALCSSAWAVAINKTEVGYTARGDNYTAFVTDGGKLTSLTIDGEEFLESRGGYAGSDGAVSVEGEKGDILLVESDKFTLRYMFAGREITVSLTSKEDVTRFGFYPNPVVVRSEDGRMYVSPMRFDNYRRAAYFTEKSNFKARNFGTGYNGEDFKPFGWLDSPKGITASGIFEIRTNTAEDRDAFLRLTKGRDYAEDVRIYEPAEYRVFQRKTAYEGFVKFTGKTLVKADRLKARVEGKSLKGLIDRTYNIPVKEGAFDFNADVPAGGWYKVTVTAYDGSKEVCRKVFHRVGVGEVFVGAGQSNSTNSGQFQTRQTSGMVSSFDGDIWRIANDPQVGVHDMGIGGSYYPAFGDAMYKRYGVPIGIVSTGQGASSVEMWQPDYDMNQLNGSFNVRLGRMYDYTLNRIKYLGAGGFRAVLWHQGETDGVCDVDKVYNGMVRVITGMRKDAGWDFPWFAAKVSYWNELEPYHKPIREVYQRLWDSGIALEGPDTDVLGADYRDRTRIHLLPDGLNRAGIMWYECVSAYLNKIL